MNPFPRIAGKVDINMVEDGYVIYQSDDDRVHYLNATAVVVLESCTGENSAEEIEQIVQTTYELSKPPTEEVRDCLKNLFEEGLIE